MNPRLKLIHTRLREQGLDALLVSSAANITYLAGYPCRDAYFLVSRQKDIILADGRYIAELKAGVDGLALKRVDRGAFKAIAGLCADLKVKRLGFEEKCLSFSGYSGLRQQLSAKIDFIPTQGIIEELRLVKSSREIEQIKKAVKITIAALEFIRDFIRAGVREIEIAAELERFIRYHGASGPAFGIIVASGANSSFAHHMTSQRRLKSGEPVLIDLGVDYFGYKSDLTRVFFLGKINPLARRVYDIVKQAQIRAINKVRPGIRISEIDQASRQHITQAGYGKFFNHSTGHGIGLEIHESPVISLKVNDLLQAGMCFTIEPAIYLPGKFGIRLEDTVLVTQKGVEVTSGALDK